MELLQCTVYCIYCDQQNCFGLKTWSRKRDSCGECPTLDALYRYIRIIPCCSAAIRSSLVLLCFSHRFANDCNLKFQFVSQAFHTNNGLLQKVHRVREYKHWASVEGTQGERVQTSAYVLSHDHRISTARKEKAGSQLVFSLLEPN